MVKDIQQGVFVQAASDIVKDNGYVQSDVLTQENDSAAKTNNDGAFNSIFINPNFTIISNACELTYHDLFTQYNYMPGEFAMLQHNHNMFYHLIITAVSSLKLTRISQINMHYVLMENSFH